LELGISLVFRFRNFSGAWGLVLGVSLSGGSKLRCARADLAAGASVRLRVVGPERVKWLRHVGVNPASTERQPARQDFCRQPKDGRPKFGLQAKTMDGNRTNGPADAGEKQAGFDVHTIS
jgi:hypothetical protein